jgi:hypothetical protein
MKITKAEQEKRTEPSAAIGSSAGPDYPYGLQLQLDDETLTKLGLATLPKVGTAKTLIARVEVTSVSVHDDKGTKRRSLSLQITECCLENETATRKPTADVLYGKDT